MHNELRTDGDAQALHLEREYEATPAEVWNAWTAPERLARWLATPSGPLSDDGPTRLTFGPGDDWADVVVLTSDEPRLLELEWNFVGEVRSVLRVEIEAVDDTRTRVVLDHRGLGGSTVGYGAGWQAYLELLGGELGGSAPHGWDELFAAALPEWQARAAG